MLSRTSFLVKATHGLIVGISCLYFIHIENTPVTVVLSCLNPLHYRFIRLCVRLCVAERNYVKIVQNELEML